MLVLLFLQMSDNSDVLKRISRRSNLKYTALTPNVQGFKAAVSSEDIKEIKSKIYCSNSKCTRFQGSGKFRGYQGDQILNILL